MNYGIVLLAVITAFLAGPVMSAPVTSGPEIPLPRHVSVSSGGRMAPSIEARVVRASLRKEAPGFVFGKVGEFIQNAVTGSSRTPVAPMGADRLAAIVHAKTVMSQKVNSMRENKPSPLQPTIDMGREIRLDTKIKLADMEHKAHPK